MFELWKFIKEERDTETEILYRKVTAENVQNLGKIHIFIYRRIKFYQSDSMQMRSYQDMLSSN